MALETKRASDGFAARVAILVTTAIAMALASLGCGEDKPARIPTYHADVAPLLATHCQACHTEGQIGPFPLTTYEEAKKYAGAIQSATAARTMPPFWLDNSGSCNTYTQAAIEGRWLTDAEIATIGAWAAAGAPEGDPKDAVAASPSQRLKLDRVDATISMDTEYTPDESVYDDYRCFILDPGFTTDQMLVGFEVRPGQPKMVHHLTLYSIDTPAAEAQAEALDAASPGMGYPCIDDIGIDDVRWLVGWGPGSGAQTFPEGTGLRMHAGRKTMLQIHYNKENGFSPDRTQIDVKLEPQVKKEASVRRVVDLALNLPPKQKGIKETDEVVVPRDTTLWGLWPHMHKLGTGLEVDSIRGGNEQCVARVITWNYHWQGFSYYTKPVHIKDGDKLRITCTYDTMSRDAPTIWGQGTNDEMCIAFFYMTND